MPTLRPGRRPRPTSMRRLAWVWFAGCIAWLVDGLISVRLHSWQHAELAFLVALVFLFAAFVYRAQRR